MLIKIFCFFIFLTLGSCSSGSGKPTNLRNSINSFKNPDLTLRKDLRYKFFLSKDEYTALNKVTDLRQVDNDPIRFFLKLDLVAVSSVLHDDVFYQLIRRAACARDMPLILAANFLLQLEWLLFYDQGKNDLASQCFLELRFCALTNAKVNNPLVFHFFKNFISYEVAALAKRINDRSTHSVNLLYYSSDDEMVISPLDVFDAIDYFARISRDSELCYLPRMHVIASLILGTNLKDYENQKDWQSYYFTLTALCATSSANLLNYSLTFLVDKLYKNKLYEPLRALYFSTGQIFTSEEKVRYYLDGFQKSNPLILNEPIWLEPKVDLNLVFNEKGELKSAKKEIIYLLARTLSLTSSNHPTSPHKAFAFIRSLLKPAIFLMSPEEAFEIFQSKLFREKLQNVNKGSSKKLLEKVSEEIFGLKAINFNHLKRLCLSFWQSMLICKESHSFLVRYGFLLTENPIPEKVISGTHQSRSQACFFGFVNNILETLLEADLTRYEIQRHIGASISRMYEDAVDPELKGGWLKPPAWHIIQDLVIQVIRSYKQDTMAFFEGLKICVGPLKANDLKILTFIPELFPGDIETEKPPAPIFEERQFEAIYKFISDEKFLFEEENIENDIIFKFLSKASAIRKEFNLLLAGKHIQNSIYIPKYCSCLILKKTVRSNLGLGGPSRIVDIPFPVAYFLDEYFPQPSGPVSTALLLSDVLVNRVVSHVKITDLTASELAILLDLKESDSSHPAGFNFRSFDSSQTKTMQEVIKMVLSGYLPNFNNLSHSSDAEKLTSLTNLLWDISREIHKLIYSSDRKLLANCCVRIYNGKINSLDELQACLNYKKPEKKQIPRRRNINEEVETIKDDEEPEEQRAIEEESAVPQTTEEDEEEEVVEEPEEDLTVKVQTQRRKKNHKPNKRAKKSRKPPQKKPNDKVELQPEPATELPSVLPETKKSEDLPSLTIPSKPEPTEIKVYALPKQENFEIVHKPGEIDLGPFGTLVTSKSNVKRTNYMEFTSLEELQSRIVVIKNSNFYEMEAFKNDAKKAIRIAVDLELSGIVFPDHYTPKDRNRLFSFQYKSAAKHGIVEIGVIFETEIINENGKKKQMIAAYCIEGSPDLNVFFSSQDFLEKYRFPLDNYKNFRINLQQVEVKAIFREFLSSGVPVYVHNGIYDMLHLIKLLYPEQFKNFEGKNTIKELDSTLNHLKFNVYDTRYIYDQLSAYILDEAKLRQKDQWLDILPPNTCSLAELSFLLLDIQEAEFHNPAVDAFITFSLGKLYEETQERHLEHEQFLPINEQFVREQKKKIIPGGEKKTVDQKFITRLEKFKNRIYSAQRTFCDSSDEEEDI